MRGVLLTIGVEVRGGDWDLLRACANPWFSSGSTAQHQNAFKCFHAAAGDNGIALSWLLALVPHCILGLEQSMVNGD